MRITALVRMAFLTAIAVLGFTSFASAQTEKQWGLVIGFPANAGVQRQLTDRVTLRADAGFDWGVIDQIDSTLSFGIVGGPSSSTTSTTTFRHSSASAGVSVLVTVSRHEQLRLYVAPRVGWHGIHSSYSTDRVVVSVGGVSTSLPGSTTSSTINGLELDGMFGANYRLGDRFSVFGETGISYTSPTASSSSSDETKSYSIGSRSHVGIVIHF